MGHARALVTGPSSRALRLHLDGSSSLSSRLLPPRSSCSHPPLASFSSRISRSHSCYSACQAQPQPAQQQQAGSHGSSAFLRMQSVQALDIDSSNASPTAQPGFPPTSPLSKRRRPVVLVLLCGLLICAVVVVVVVLLVRHESGSSEGNTSVSFESTLTTAASSTASAATQPSSAAAAAAVFSSASASRSQTASAQSSTSSAAAGAVSSTHNVTYEIEVGPYEVTADETAAYEKSNVAEDQAGIPITYNITFVQSGAVLAGVRLDNWAANAQGCTAESRRRAPAAWTTCAAGS